MHIQKYSQKLDTQELLGQLPPLQNLLFRLLDCKVTFMQLYPSTPVILMTNNETYSLRLLLQPEGAAAYNRLIQYALSVVRNILL